MIKKQRQTKGQIEYRRRNSKLYPVYTSILKVIMPPEKYFQRVVLG